MFSIFVYRETRNRHHFKDRYDNRFNLIDWDYTMRIQPEASILHFLHYSHFRNSGLGIVFFTLPLFVVHRSVDVFGFQRSSI
jgi:hypothetical protein